MVLGGGISIRAGIGVGRSFFEERFFKALFFEARKTTSRFILGLFAVLLSSAPLIRGSQAEEVRFAPLVHFKLASTFGAGEIGTLKTTFNAKDIEMVLTNVAVAGADKAQQLLTLVDRSDLSLIQSRVYDQAKGKPIREMVRKIGTSILGSGKAEIFEYREFSDGKVTTTEPYIQFKVADFVSVMLIAADAINRKDMQPADVSMLRDRSVTRVILRITGQETVGDRQGTVVRVAPPDNPSGGIAYTIARTDDGAYFPARISVETSRGLVQLDGSIQ